MKFYFLLIVSCSIAEGIYLGLSDYFGQDISAGIRRYLEYRNLE